MCFNPQSTNSYTFNISLMGQIHVKHVKGSFGLKVSLVSRGILITHASLRHKPLHVTHALLILWFTPDPRARPVLGICHLLRSFSSQAEKSWSFTAWFALCLIFRHTGGVGFNQISCRVALCAVCWSFSFTFWEVLRCAGEEFYKMMWQTFSKSLVCISLSLKKKRNDEKILCFDHK